LQDFPKCWIDWFIYSHPYCYKCSIWKTFNMPCGAFPKAKLAQNFIRKKHVSNRSCGEKWNTHIMSSTLSPCALNSSRYSKLILCCHIMRTDGVILIKICIGGPCTDFLNLLMFHVNLCSINGTKSLNKDVKTECLHYDQGDQILEIKNRDTY
jgi:hypothetical protein